MADFTVAVPAAIIETGMAMSFGPEALQLPKNHHFYAVEMVEQNGNIVLPMFKRRTLEG